MTKPTLAKGLIVLGDGRTTFGEEMVDGMQRHYSEYHYVGYKFAPDGSVSTRTEETIRTYAPKDES